MNLILIILLVAAVWFGVEWLAAKLVKDLMDRMQ